MKILDLPVENRELLGSAAARRYCRAGKIPTNLYGRGQDSVSLVLDADDFQEVLKAHSAIVRLSLGGVNQTALVREVNWDTFGDYIQHIDLMRVELEDEITIQVPVHFTGIPVGASHGGVLQIVHKEISVYCRVNAIPTEILFDVTHLELDDRVNMGDLELPENVRAELAEDELIAHVKEPRIAIEPTDEEEVLEGEEGEGEGEEGEAAEGEGAEGEGAKKKSED